MVVGLELPMQSVPITTNVRIPLRRGVLDKMFCDKVCQWLATGRWFSPGTPVSSTNKIDLHDITEIVESGVEHNKCLLKKTSSLIEENLH